MLFPWRIAVNHFRNEAHQQVLGSSLRASGAKCNPPPWSVKTRPIKSRAATPCHARRNPHLRRTPTANALRPTRATSGVDRAGRRQSYLPFLREAIRRTACPICPRAEHARPKSKTVNYRSLCLIISAGKSTLAPFPSRASWSTLFACFAVLEKRPFSWLACAENSVSFTTDVSLIPRKRCYLGL